MLVGSDEARVLTPKLKTIASGGSSLLAMVAFHVKLSIFFLNQSMFSWY